MTSLQKPCLEAIFIWSLVINFTIQQKTVGQVGQHLVFRFVHIFITVIKKHADLPMKHIQTLTFGCGFFILVDLFQLLFYNFHCAIIGFVTLFARLLLASISSRFLVD